MENEHLNDPIAQETAEDVSLPGKKTTKKKEKLTHKEKRQRWKAAKKAKRDATREFYRYAPPLRKAWHYWLRTTLIVLVLLGLFAALFGQDLFFTFFNDYVTEIRQKPLDEKDRDKIYELSPIDEEGAARIEALPSGSPDDTWTICVYLVGADLEDDGENDLSYVTSFLTSEERSALAAEKQAKRVDSVVRFNSELADSGLELPAFFYDPEKPVESEPGEESVLATRKGFASTDIEEMIAETWSDNISIVIQTGGAKRWSNQIVNPNRTQRFEYKGGQFSEVDNLPLQPSYDPETLADFIRFCKDEYPSDHRILILWNHGGGPFGYGNDSIYGGAMSLKDVRTALSSVYEPNSDDPAFDIIGFDACLMSTLEVTNALDGFAAYYCLSEESEPGDGWDYTPWLQALSDDPAMNPAKVAREIADTYTDHYMTQNVNVTIDLLRSLLSQDVTFSVIDGKKASELYDAYCSLVEAQLVDAAKDMSVLSEIGRCGSKATRFGGSAYNVFNMVDLGNYVDYMIDSYPEQCSAIKDLIGEAVLYHRENGALSDSTGIAVYLPTTVKDIFGLLYFLDYVYNISEDESIAALYYYKQAGCLNEEMLSHVETLTDVTPKVLDVTPFRQFSRIMPLIDEEGFMIPIDEELQSMLVDYELEVGLYDEGAHKITYYGRDSDLYLDGEGHLCSSFDGTWVSLGGVPLSVEVVSSSASSVEYRSHILYNGADSYLMFSFDRDTETFTINGVCENASENDVNSFVNTRSRTDVAIGSRIVPIYMETDYSAAETTTVRGDTIKFHATTKLTRELLPKGYYICAAVISDQRGDSYYSAVVGGTVAGDTIKDWNVDKRFYGSNY